MLINAKKRLSAANPPVNLGITSNDIRKLFKVWNADFLGVNTSSLAGELELNKDFTRDMYGTIPYDVSEDPCSLSQDIDVSEWASFMVDMSCGLVKEGYKLPKGANRISFRIARVVQTLPDEEGEYPNDIYNDIKPYAKKVFIEASTKLKNACSKVENDIGYFHFVNSNYDVERDSDAETFCNWFFEVWFIPFSE